MNKSICIYSVITNCYDDPKPVTFKNIPHILFTDNPDIKAPGWQIVDVEKTKDQRLQRKIKILGHEALEKYDVTVYIDAAITLKSTFSTILNRYTKGFIIGAHPKRKCVYAEGLAVKEQNKAPKELVNKQISEYYDNDFPSNFGMWSSGVLIRDKSLKEFNEIWHSKLEQHSHRDQLSLPWAVWKTGIRPQEINMYAYMTIAKHKSKEPLKVFYSTPFLKGNIGKANNDFIKLLPDDAWVCITDADAMFLNPDFGTRIEHIINKFGNEYQLIGCLCNRLGGLHQCYDGKFSEDMDMRNHLEIANKVLPDEIKDGAVAGFFMLFSKQTWKSVGGFKEGIITADSEFNKSIIRLKGKTGVYQGLYMFHAYRLHEQGHKNAWQSTSHLK